MTTTLPAPRPAAAPLPAREHYAAQRQSNVMLSRVAASLYWMSRYLERAENVARLLDVNLQLLLDVDVSPTDDIEAHWLPLLRSAGAEQLFFQHYPSADSRSVTEFMTFRADNPSSVWSCIAAARENARQVRDQISLEMWEVLNEAWLFLKSTDATEVWNDGASEFFEKIKRFSHLFQGIADSTFSRAEGYEFMQFGKFLERADKTLRILDIKYHVLLPKASDVGGAVDTAQWQAVLRSASALEAYRRFYVTEILPWKVAEFLIFSESFPRSLRYCVERVNYFVGRISGLPPGHFRNHVDRQFARFLNDLTFTTVEEVYSTGLHEFLTRATGELEGIGNFIYQTYMYHPPVDLAAEIHQQQEQQQQQ